MAGKEPSGKTKRPITPEGVERYVTELRGYAAKLAEISRQMREHRIGELEVLSQPTADIGLRYFNSLVQSCEREIKDAKDARRNGKS